MFFFFSAMQVGLAGWTFAGPPIVGKWAAGVFTMIDQFKGGSGVRLLSIKKFFLCCIASIIHDQEGWKADIPYVAGVQIFFGICCIINMVLWGLAGLLGFAVWGEVCYSYKLSFSLCL